MGLWQQAVLKDANCLEARQNSLAFWIELLEMNDWSVGAEAAGQRDEAISQLGHERLALVHGADDVELRQAGVPDLAGHQRLGNHPDDLTTSAERGVCQQAHQADGGSAIDQPDSAPRQFAAQFLRGSGEI